MKLRELWFNINETGELNLMQFKMFCKIIDLVLDEEDCTNLIKVFGGKITFDNFSYIIKHG